MGRIIRKSKTKEIAIIINLFIKDTTDERVFTKINWEKFIGKDIMKTYNWSDKKEIKLTEIEKIKFRTATQEDKRIISGEISAGDKYTAHLEGDRFSFDTSWKLFKKQKGKRFYALNQEDLKSLVEMIKKIKPEAGQFYINNENHVITKDKQNNVLFAGMFDKNKIRFE